mmetsp:Transcript_43145/g.85462  ORF Transcript_43145/g.85462 Transcript_43145/m.85462 type:complete len:288 (+) Transcript_43145:128-991(+)
MYSASCALGETSDQDELPCEVPSLLESMNRASSEVNSFESQLCNAQERHSRFLDQWSRLYDDMLAQHGRAIRHAKPYFDAAQVLHTATQSVQNAVREFSASSVRHAQSKRDLQLVEERLLHDKLCTVLDVDMQERLSYATLEVHRCQTERDTCEQEYVRALHDCNKAQESLVAWRNRLGPLAIRRIQPCFQQLHEHQLRLATEQARISFLTERVRNAKVSYCGSLKELDRISTAVHVSRKSRTKMDPTMQRERADVRAGSPEETPEAVPEVEHETARELCLAADVFT